MGQISKSYLEQVIEEHYGRCRRESGYEHGNKAKLDHKITGFNQYPIVSVEFLKHILFLWLKCNRAHCPKLVFLFIYFFN